MRVISDISEVTLISDTSGWVVHTDATNRSVDPIWVQRAFEESGLGYPYIRVDKPSGTLTKFYLAVPGTPPRGTLVRRWLRVTGRGDPGTLALRAQGHSSPELFGSGGGTGAETRDLPSTGGNWLELAIPSGGSYGYIFRAQWVTDYAIRPTPVGSVSVSPSNDGLVRVSWTGTDTDDTDPDLLYTTRRVELMDPATHAVLFYAAPIGSATTVDLSAIPAGTYRMSIWARNVYTFGNSGLSEFVQNITVAARPAPTGTPAAPATTPGITRVAWNFSPDTTIDPAAFISEVRVGRVEDGHFFASPGGSGALDFTHYQFPPGAHVMSLWATTRYTNGTPDLITRHDVTVNVANLAWTKPIVTATDASTPASPDPFVTLRIADTNNAVATRPGSTYAYIGGGVQKWSHSGTGDRVIGTLDLAGLPDAVRFSGSITGGTLSVAMKNAAGATVRTVTTSPMIPAAGEVTAELSVVATGAWTVSDPHLRRGTVTGWNRTHRNAIYAVQRLAEGDEWRNIRVVTDRDNPVLVDEISLTNGAAVVYDPAAPAGVPLAYRAVRTNATAQGDTPAITSDPTAPLTITESNVAMLLDPQLPDAQGRVVLSLDRVDMPTWEVSRPTRGVELTPIGRPNSVVVSDIAIGGARGRVVAHTFDLAGKRAMEALLKRPPRPLLLRPGLVDERYWVAILGDLKLKCVNPGGAPSEQVWKVEFDWVEVDPPAGWV